MIEVKRGGEREGERGRGGDRWRDGERERERSREGERGREMVMKLCGKRQK